MKSLVILFAVFYLLCSFTGKLILFFKNYEIKKNQNISSDLWEASGNSNDRRGLYRLDHISKTALFFAMVVVLLSIAVPFLIVYDESSGTVNFLNKNIIGDTIGGTMGPLVALAGVLVTGLAFYMQYRANQIQREIFDTGLQENRDQFNQQLTAQQLQFRIQQFEGQFFEMLRLHKENIGEMAITGYLHEPNPDYFLVSSKEDGSHLDATDIELGGKNLNSKIHPTRRVERILTGRKIFVAMNAELKSCYKIMKQELKGKKIDREIILKLSYHIFFLGLLDFKKELPSLSAHYGISKELLEKVHGALKFAKDQHYEQGIKKCNGVALEFNYKPYTGHQSRLAHYYRHLFQMLKFVTKEHSSGLSYENKRDLLRILRAQLSNHEQLLLFYNWYSDFGFAWEEKRHELRLQKKGNYYFTDYRMIHNIPVRLLIKDFDLHKIFSREYRYFLYEKGRIQEDTLFELIDIKTLLN